MTTFAMALAKKPISAQKRGKKRRYQQEIREAAMLKVGKAKLPLLDGELYARIWELKWDNLNSGTPLKFARYAKVISLIAS